MGGIMSTLKKLDISLTMAQMWKQYNKLHETNTVDMDVEELMSHREVLKLIKKDLNFAKKMWQRFRTRISSRISICCILN
jgi:hypothetical protein